MGVKKTIDISECVDTGYYELATYTYENGNKKLLDRTSVAVVEDTDFVDDKSTSKFAINSHIFQGYWNNENFLLEDEIKKLGVKNVRDGHYWSAMSTEEGVLNPPETAFMNAADDNGIGTYIVGGFTNSVYMEENEIAPETTKAINAFCDYARKICETYKQQGIKLEVFEVWNEYWSWYWDYSVENYGAIDSGAKYAKLYKAVYEALKDDYPEVKIAAGFARDNVTYLDWNEKAMAVDGMSDALSLATLHAYGGVDHMLSADNRPEFVSPIATDDPITELRTLLDSKGCQEVELWLTETGYSSLPIDINGDTVVISNSSEHHTNRFCVTEKEAAMFMPRLLLLALSKGTERVYTYQVVDYPFEDVSHENYYGLLRDETAACGLYSPKPQYVSYAVLIRALDGMDYKSVTINNSCYRYEFGNATEGVSVLYSIDGEKTYQYETATPVEVTDIMGNKKTLTPVNGKVTLTLDGNVQYVRAAE